MGGSQISRKKALCNTLMAPKLMSILQSSIAESDCTKKLMSVVAIKLLPQQDEDNNRFLPTYCSQKPRASLW